RVLSVIRHLNQTFDLIARYRRGTIPVLRRPVRQQTEDIAASLAGKLVNWSRPHFNPITHSKGAERSIDTPLDHPSNRAARKAEIPIAACPLPVYWSVANPLAFEFVYNFTGIKTLRSDWRHLKPASERAL